MYYEDERIIPETDIQIRSTGITVIYREGDNKIEKKVTPQALLQTLAGYGQELNVFETPTIPGIIKYKKTHKSEEVVIRVEPMTSFVRLNGAVFEGVHYPSLLFRLKIVGNIVGSCQIVAVKDQEVSDETQLFMFPYTNVNGADACWGEIPFKFKSYAEVARLPYRWYGSDSTFCYYGHNNLSGMEIRQFLEYNSLAKRASFDMDSLKPFNVTLGEWMK